MISAQDSGESVEWSQANEPVAPEETRGATV